MAKKKFQPAEFQTDGCSGFVRIYHDFMESPAWRSLSLRQRGLYVEFLRRYKEKRANGEIVSSNKDEIHFTEQEATRKGPNGEKPLYGSKITFSKDVKALIEAGFIRVVQSGYYSRSVNVYGFSSRWKQYQPGKPPAIPEQDRQRKDANNHGRPAQKKSIHGLYIMSTATVLPAARSSKKAKTL
jgi:hypothetical protein